VPVQATGADNVPYDEPQRPEQTTMLKAWRQLATAKYFSASNLSQVQLALAQDLR